MNTETTQRVKNCLDLNNRVLRKTSDYMKAHGIMGEEMVGTYESLIALNNELTEIINMEVEYDRLLNIANSLKDKNNGI